MSSINRFTRAESLRRLGDEPTVDVLVVGGGVTGAGVAVDAASRGLRTVLVEKNDLAFGTSRWSSKLAHGGLRYLASGNLAIAQESATERGILMTRTAPHLVRGLAQLVPLLPPLTARHAALVRMGFQAGDVLRATAGTSTRLLPRPRSADVGEALRLAPTVWREGLRGGLLAWDGQLVDDARLVATLARTAAFLGADVLTRVAAHEVTGDGATLVDQLTGERLALSARAVVNAAGVWAGQVDPSITLRPSRGTHLVFDAATFADASGARLGCSLTVPVPGSVNRFVFAFPAAHNRVYLGLTDEDAPGPVPDVPSAADSEVRFLLETVNTALAEPLTEADVLGTYSGLRPLLDHGGGQTSDISRKHAVLTSGNGLLTVVGGKLTTYRRMAEDAVDKAVATRGLAAGRCVTRNLPVVGAVAGPARSLLERRYGTGAQQVKALVAADPTLVEPVAPGVDVLTAELVFSVLHEGALDVADLLERRTRIALVARDAAAARPAAERALALAGEMLEAGPQRGSRGPGPRKYVDFQL